MLCCFDEFFCRIPSNCRSTYAVVVTIIINAEEYWKIMLVAGKMSCVESHVIVAWLLHTCTLPALRFATAPLCLAATAAAAAVTTPRLWLTLDQRVLNCLKNLPQDENFKKWASKVAHNWPKPYFSNSSPPKIHFSYHNLSQDCLLICAFYQNGNLIVINFNPKQ